MSVIFNEEEGARTKQPSTRNLILGSGSNKLKLQIYYQNVRGIRTNTDLLYNSVLVEDYDVILFTETWLTDSFHSAELLDGRCNILRRDRQSGAASRGGGVLIAAKKWMRNELVKEYCDSALEYLVVKVRCHKVFIFVSWV